MLFLRPPVTETVWGVGFDAVINVFKQLVLVFGYFL